MRPTLLLLILSLAACRQERQFTFESFEEVFCDGTTVTAIVEIEDIRASSSPLEHGSGRHDAVTRWTGAIRWGFPQTPASGRMMPLVITALGREQATAKDERGASLPAIGVRAFSGQGTLLDVDIYRGTLSLRRADDPAANAIAEVDIDPVNSLDGGVLPTRSGRHLLAKHRGRTLIFSTAELELAREIVPSPGVTDFEQRFRGIEDHTRILTDDLRYLVKVPFNAGEPQGWNHCKAVVYDLENDTTHEVALELGDGPTEIEDAESVGGELRFFTRREGEVLVVDSRSTVLGSLPTAHFGAESMESRLFWDPARKRIAAWKLADPGFPTLCALQVTDLDYGTDTTVSYELDPGDAIAVIRRQ